MPSSLRIGNSWWRHWGTHCRAYTSGARPRGSRFRAGRGPEGDWSRRLNPPERRQVAETHWSRGPTSKDRFADQRHRVAHFPWRADHHSRGARNASLFKGRSRVQRPSRQLLESDFRCAAERDGHARSSVHSAQRTSRSGPSFVRERRFRRGRRRDWCRRNSLRRSARNRPAKLPHKRTYHGLPRTDPRRAASMGERAQGPCALAWIRSEFPALSSSSWAIDQYGRVRPD